MKCSHGGCQTDAVVTVTPASTTLSGDYEPIGDERAACRFHMATICQESAVSIVARMAD